MSVKLRFLSETTLASTVVCGFTWSEWSHVEIALPEGYLGARNDGKGVAIRPFGYMTDIKRCGFATVECDDVTTAKILDFAKEQVGKKYDWLAIVGIAVHQELHMKDRWICSALVNASFNAGEHPILNPKVATSWVSPGEIAGSPLVVFDKRANFLGA